MKQIRITLLLLSIFQYGFSQIKYDDGPIINSSNFVTRGSWGRSNITFSFINGTNDIANDDERIAVRQAFQIWADYGILNFTEVTSNADIEISWQVGVHGDGNPFDGVNRVLAHAFFPPPNGTGTIAGDIHFDDAEVWTLDERPIPSGQPMDLVTVAAHEIGHALGLDHSNVACALMNPFYNGSQRYLSQDDIDGIRSIYGQRSPILSNNTSCSGGTYFLSNVPTGATVTWQSSNTTFATVTTSNNQGILTRVPNNNGTVAITATLTLPCGIIINETMNNIKVGTPYTGFNISSYIYPDQDCYEVESINTFQATLAFGESGTGFQWGYRILGVTSDIIYPYNSPYFTLIPDQPGTYEIFVRPTNDCGVGVPESVKTITVSYACGGFARFTTSPNPTTGDILVEATDTDKKTSIKEIQVADKLGNIKKKIKLNGDTKKTKINIAELPADTYIIRIYDGKTWVSKKVIKN